MIYSISWNGKQMTNRQRIAFMYEGNLLYGIVVGWNRLFTNLMVQVDALSY